MNDPPDDGDEPQSSAQPDGNVIELHGGPGFWSGFATDTFVAPGLSALTDPCLPDLSDLRERSRGWAAGFILRTIFDGLDRDPGRQLFLSSLHRSSLAVAEYEWLRTSLPEFLAVRNQKPGRYFDVLPHVERVVTEARLAIACMREIQRVAGQVDPGVEPPDFVRLRKFHEAVKHFDTQIRSKQAQPGMLVPIWLTNSGLCGVGVEGELAYERLAELLRALGRNAEYALTFEPQSPGPGPTSTS